MGYTTDFVGHIDIHPPLSAAECEYLTAFKESRRCQRPGGRYAVPGNPFAEEALPVAQSNAVALGQPSLWCHWEPCPQGCCLSFDGLEKSYAPVDWLRYLIQHFLKPRAAAALSDEEWFTGFTFDHVLEGMVVGCRRDNKELFAINVRNNRVSTKILRAAPDTYGDGWSLPYEVNNDRALAARERRRRQ